MTLALDCDVLVAGGGPAGLAVAIAARIYGLSAIVLERRASPPDKACGECLMPPAVFLLERDAEMLFCDCHWRAAEAATPAMVCGDRAIRGS
jgi:flavin-dependent dehydrogenase